MTRAIALAHTYRSKWKIMRCSTHKTTHNIDQVKWWNSYNWLTFLQLIESERIGAGAALFFLLLLLRRLFLQIHHTAHDRWMPCSFQSARFVRLPLYTCFWKPFSLLRELNTGSHVRKFYKCLPHNHFGLICVVIAEWTTLAPLVHSRIKRIEKSQPQNQDQWYFSQSFGKWNKLLKSAVKF